MDQTKALSIYVAEQMLSDSRYEEQVDWYHAYLILAKEVNQQSIPQQELHFELKTGGTMNPTIRTAAINPTHKHLCLIENASITLAYWNYALQFAEHIRENDIVIQFKNKTSQVPQQLFDRAFRFFFFSWHQRIARWG